jgi:inosine-uridine nucleoside N-ribohydrolase
MLPKSKIILDTDIGSDIDDALALAYLLCEPRCELLGVTTVTSYPELRASMCSAICRNAGRPDIPIHVGSPQALRVPLIQKDAAQARVLGAWDCAKFTRDNTAVEFLHRQINEHPGEITLLAIGPMTNVALLFATHPEDAAKLKSLALMCGRFLDIGGYEWNAINDPDATFITYGNGPQSKPPAHFSCGLDVTRKCVMGRDEARRRFKNFKILAPVADFAEVWFEHSEQITFHDPLAAVCCFDPDVCEWKDVFVNISLTHPTAGWTIPDWHAAEKPHKIAANVDTARFFDLYFKNLR